MWADDTASAGLGMRLVSVGTGTAVLEMPVRDDMVNGHGMAHGGFVFTLADSAFAFACNTYNQVTVGQGCRHHVRRTRPARRPACRRGPEQTIVRPHGIYDVTVPARGRRDRRVPGRSRRSAGSISKEELMTRAAYLVDGVRTPIGRYGGALAAVRPDDLAAHVIAALVAGARRRSGAASTT